MAKRNVFYSWRDDGDHKLNRSFIQGCLERAIKKLNREDDLDDLIVDRDTKHVPGMPDIGQTVLEKIEKAVVVVADLSIINPKEIRRSDERPVSNPNVVFELGYAFGKLGPKAIIGVINTALGEVEELPFDLRPKRLLKYRLDSSDDKAVARQELIDDLVDAIRLCLGETEADKITLASKAKNLAAELQLFGEEIEEWKGIESLPQVLKSLSEAAEKNYAAMNQLGHSEDLLGHVGYVVQEMRKAAKLAITDENWSKIVECVKSAAFTIGMVEHFWQLNLEEAAHDRIVQELRTIPDRLEQHIVAVKSDSCNRNDLEKLTVRLRKLSFYPLVQEYPQFIERLTTISLEMRKWFLRGVLHKPTAEEAATSLQGFRQELIDLLAKYVP